MQSRYLRERKILAIMGGAIFTFTALIIYFTYWDWVPRTCTVSGCPDAFSFIVISSYVKHDSSLLLTNLVALGMVVFGVRGLASSSRTRIGVLYVLAGVILSVIVFSVLVYEAGTHATVTSATTITSTITVSKLPSG